MHTRRKVDLYMYIQQIALALQKLIKWINWCTGIYKIKGLVPMQSQSNFYIAHWKWEDLWNKKTSWTHQINENAWQNVAWIALKHMIHGIGICHFLRPDWAIKELSWWHCHTAWGWCRWPIIFWRWSIAGCRCRVHHWILRTGDDIAMLYCLGVYDSCEH